MPRTRQEDQLQITSCLRIIGQLDRELVVCPFLDLPAPDEIDHPQKTLIVLNWIALLFSSKTGNSYATCLSDDSKSVTLHIAGSENAPSYEDNAMAKTFLEMIDFLTRGAGKAWKAPQRLMCVNRTLIHMCWAHVWAKMKSAQSIVKNANRDNRLISLINKWFDHRAIKGREANTSTELDEEAKKHNTTVKDTICSFLLKLLEVIDSPPCDDEDELLDLRHQAFNKALFICSMLNRADCLRCFHQTKPDEEWLSKLDATDTMAIRNTIRAAQDILEYHHGATYFITYGLKYFRRFTSDSLSNTRIEDLIKVVWVNDMDTAFRPQNAPQAPSQVPLVWTTTPMDYISSLRESAKNRRVEIKEDGQRHALQQKCANLWKIGDLVTSGGKLYAEIRLAVYLYHHDIKTVHRVIGIGEPPCECSFSFLGATGLVFRGCSKKTRPDWLVPSEDTAEGKKEWVSLGVGFALATMRKSTISVVDAFLVDQKAEHLKDPNYQKKVRYSAKDRMYTSVYEDWEEELTW